MKLSVIGQGIKMENKEITLEQAIVFLEMNAYEGSNAKAVLRMGDVHEVLKPIKGLIDKSAKMERHIERLERQNKRLLKREEPQEPCIIEGKKFCPACGDELTDVDPGLFEYCFYCGTKLYQIGVIKMSKLTKEERLLHALNGIKQVLDNLGVEDIKNEVE